MRGADTFTESLFTMRQLEDFVPADHPLRAIRLMVNAALVKVDVLFSKMYEADIKGGRPSGLQPHAHAITGQNPSTDIVRSRNCEKTALKPSQMGSARPKSSRCERSK